MGELTIREMEQDGDFAAWYSELIDLEEETAGYAGSADERLGLGESAGLDIGQPDVGGALPDRLERAYAHAVVLGFTDADAIARFLRYEATAPNFYHQPAIDAWLRRPGQPVEQRFTDVLMRVKSGFRRE